MVVPVALEAGQPRSDHVWGELCLPRGRHPHTVQLLVHGATYNHTYFDFGVVNGTNYSYVDAALGAGYAVLAIDRLGDGQSSHPASTDLTFPHTIFTLHEVVQDLRRGAVGPGFDRVMYVGHSFGSAYGVDEAATYSDLDALILTGYGHAISPTYSALGTADSYPAVSDALFADRGLDSGYLTSVPGTRAAQHYYGPGADPDVIARDEATKDLLSLSELTSRPNTSLLTPDIRVPVLLLDGDHDVHYCAADADDCSSQTVFASEESPFFSAAACLHTFLVPNTGHDLALHRSAPISDAMMLRWARHYLSPAGVRGKCAHQGTGGARLG